MTDTYVELRRRAVRRFRWVGLILPLSFLAVLSAVLVALLPQMPDPAATHWGLSGEPDGFGPAWTLPLMLMLSGGAPVAVVGGLALAGVPTNSGRRMPFQLVSALVWGIAGFVGVAMFLSGAVQVGLDSAEGAREGGWFLGIGLAAAVVLALLGWLTTFSTPAVGRADALASEGLRLAPTERAVWIRTVTLARAGMVVLAAAVVVTAGLALTTAILDLRLAGSLTAGTWITIGACALVAAAAALSSVFEVRVDGDGLTVRGPLGWPRRRVPRPDIRSVEVVSVSPMAEYGGWGWRYGVAGVGLGVVMRAGEAIRVTTAAGKTVTVTVDDAETGAALLRGMTADDRRAGQGGAGSGPRDA